MNNTRRFSRLAATAAASLLLLAGQAHAANLSKEVYKGAKADLETMYQAQKKACDAHSGNAKDVCVETAKGQEKVALAQLEYNYSGSARDEAKLYQARADAVYEIAKEKCDDATGNDKDVCNKTAKGEHDKAKADLKLAKKVSAATEDALEAHVKADYKVAREKCDALSGDAKDVCTASAKARFNLR
ncbi:hypothetical protein [Aquabacterium sp. OR-4]|uniref:hypothetical protein n=1 Tax=Aquabacterium sp. OR-4 TaxID=2978127 RepID=UPI0021B18C15|nr:hypothetical protein [Aquabacterium sp. OR-4]MDT7835042.1 hypothetical protein [Aquabacterium sp. OR-4]